MTGSIIDTTVTNTVTLGNAGYLSPLTITSAGAIAPVAAGATALDVPASLTGGFILNDGHITGGAGNLAGGIGVELAGLDTLENFGVVAGGLGGYGLSYASAGGIGVELSAGTLLNSGTILGGYGGTGGGVGGDGGIGLYLAAHLTASNAGTIIGGHGGDGMYKYHLAGASAGGEGVSLNTGDQFTNTGFIAGGIGGAYGTLGQIGAGGIAVYVDDALLINKGYITAGTGDYDATAAAAVFLFEEAELQNSGTIIGGRGDIFETGGDGVFAFGPFNIVNHGLIEGGTNLSGVLDVAGGYGVYLDGGGIVTNAGTIRGGLGGSTGKTIYDAVKFGPVAGTLVVENGAKFKGDVVANAAADDVLEFSGSSSKAFKGIGKTVLDFNGFSFATGAAWRISGDVTAFDAGQTISGFTASDSLDLLKTTGANGKVTVKKAGVVTIKAGGTVYTLDIEGAAKGATNFTFSNHILTETAAPAKMQFIAPAAARAAPESLAPLAHTAPGGTSLWTGAAPKATGAVPEFRTLPHTDLLTIATLHAGGFG